MVGESSRRRATAGDEAMVRALYAEHGGAVLAYATKLTGDRAAAEDVLQETLVRAWRKPEVFVNGKGSVRAWMFTVARNLVVDRARARAARPAEVAEHPAAQPLTRDHAEQVVDSLVVLERWATCPRSTAACSCSCTSGAARCTRRPTSWVSHRAP